ncbi:hypothetical protein [Thermococcus sp.]|uniref:hypothetical protein n=1 Tax=Thermococcus sp. TaxID=35749 RepID=UPI00260F7D07|nr:hypothetical protein [Thermococcus sp.]
MRYEVIKTGIAPLDSMLGGGILEDSLFLMVYDMRSFGWTLGVEMFRNFLDSGWFGVITDYSLPYTLLCRYASAINFDLEGMGKSGRLAIIDVFGSVNGIPPREPFVHTLGNIDGSTFLPKIVSLYSRLVEGEEKRVGLTVTLDGFTAIFGEELGIKILQKNIALKDAAARTQSGARPVNIFLLNRDRVSRRFLSWVSQYSEHIVEFLPTEVPGVERMLVRKSLLPDFKPGIAEFRFSRGKIRIKPEIWD